MVLLSWNEMLQPIAENEDSNTDLYLLVALAQLLGGFLDTSRQLESAGFTFPLKQDPKLPT